MRGDEGVHERLEVGAPPLRQAVADLPAAGLLALAQLSDGRQPLVQARLEALDLVVLGSQVVAGQLEEGIRYLQHQDVGVVVLVADEDALARAAHAVGIVVLLEALESGDHRRVLLGLRLLDTECVVRQRKQADRLRLVRVEGKWDDGRVRALERCHRDRGHRSLVELWWVWLVAWRCQRSSITTVDAVGLLLIDYPRTSLLNMQIWIFFGCLFVPSIP